MIDRAFKAAPMKGGHEEKFDTIPIYLVGVRLPSMVECHGVYGVDIFFVKEENILGIFCLGTKCGIIRRLA
ncbi:MAG: hypothetical protein RIN55_12520 [Tissierellaceae bacterium]|nr:hypothetical protein [Tissierellaceae bacterium]